MFRQILIFLNLYFIFNKLCLFMPLEMFFIKFYVAIWSKVNVSNCQHTFFRYMHHRKAWVEQVRTLRLFQIYDVEHFCNFQLKEVINKKQKRGYRMRNGSKRVNFFPKEQHNSEVCSMWVHIAPVWWISKWPHSHSPLSELCVWGDGKGRCWRSTRPNSSLQRRKLRPRKAHLVYPKPLSKFGVELRPVITCHLYLISLGA